MKVLKSYRFSQDFCKYFGMKMIKIWKMFKVIPRVKNKNETSKRYWSHFGETKNALLHAITPIFRLRSWLSAKKVASWGVVLKISTSRPLNIVPIGSDFVPKYSLFYFSFFHSQIFSVFRKDKDSWVSWGHRHECLTVKTTTLLWQSH